MRLSEKTNNSRLLNISHYQGHIRDVDLCPGCKKNIGRCRHRAVEIRNEGLYRVSDLRCYFCYLRDVSEQVTRALYLLAGKWPPSHDL